MHGINAAAHEPGNCLSLLDNTVHNLNALNPTNVVELKVVKHTYYYVVVNSLENSDLRVVIVVNGMLSITPDTALCIDASDMRRGWPSLNICGLD